MSTASLTSDANSADCTHWLTDSSWVAKTAHFSTLWSSMYGLDHGVQLPRNNEIACSFWGLPYAVGLLSCLPVCPVLSVMLVHRVQTVGWIRMPLCAEVGPGPGDIVLDGDPTPTEEVPWGEHSSPHFLAKFALVRSPISAAAELLLTTVF